MNDGFVALTTFFYIYIAIFGLLIGSFLNVVALRLSDGASLVRPPSHCPHCKTQLRALELLPVISYIWRKGRCRHCHAPISALYPLGEVLTASLFLLMVWLIGWQLELLVALLFVATLVVALVADSARGLIPFRFVVPALVCMLLLRALTDGLAVWQALVAVGAMYVVFFVIDWLRTKWAPEGQAAFGGGDIMLFLFIAATLGLKLTLLTLFLASVFGLLFALFGIARSRADGAGAVRFAPAILPAAILSYLWGEWLLAAYFDLFTIL